MAVELQLGLGTMLSEYEMPFIGSRGLCLSAAGLVWQLLRL